MPYRKLLYSFIGLVIIAVIGVAFWRSRGNEDTARTATVTRQDIVQDVAFTGRLAAEQIADLSFALGGPVREMLVDVGDEVTAGQTLARLDTTTASLEVAKAGADQAAAEEEKRRSWQKAADEYLNLKAENDRLLEKRRQAVRDAKVELDRDRVTFQRISNESGDNSSTTSTAQAAVIAAETAWHTAGQALEETIKTVQKTNDSARAAADIAQAQYESIKQTAPNVAGLSSLEASAALARHKLVQSTITAPFDGVITSRLADVDEYLAAGATALTLQTTNTLELIARVPETDAASLTVGQRATLTFDALPATDTWDAEVTHLSPAAEIIEGVPTYEVTLVLAGDTNNLKPGLTANITVHAARASGVLAIPRRAVITRDNEQIVRLLAPNGEITEQTITTGLTGSTGQIEVLSGLSAGDQVITSTLAEE